MKLNFKLRPLKYELMPILVFLEPLLAFIQLISWLSLTFFISISSKQKIKKNTIVVLYCMISTVYCIQYYCKLWTVIVLRKVSENIKTISRTHSTIKLHHQTCNIHYHMIYNIPKRVRIKSDYYLPHKWHNQLWHSD